VNIKVQGDSDLHRQWIRSGMSKPSPAEHSES